ncbi:MAG: hypothetical protein Q8P21_02740 [bacterium]|nr:hypothetical protein [bacterium]
MEPKFQSSFIPKGPITSGAAGMSVAPKIKERSLLAFLALVIFIISVLLALGTFGYGFYLKYRIDQMGANLERARATLEPETIRELTRLDDQITSTTGLIAGHRVLSPLFEFLEESTPRTVRFNDFKFSMTEQGLELNMKGEARGYAALALQADIFSKSEYFKDPAFSDLSLNERGDVGFSFKAMVDQDLLSYQREAEQVGAPAVLSPATSTVPVTGSAATSTTSTTSTSSPQATSPQR